MKHIVITGSTRGIGFGLAREFLKTGNKVTICGRSKNTLKNALAALEKEFGRENIQGVSCDAARPRELENLLRHADKKQGKIDIWINNAGISHTKENIWEIPEREIEDVIRINILGAVYGSRIAYRYMAEQGGGAIYNMEGLGSNGMITPGLGLYGTSKKALTYFTRALCREAGKGPVKIGFLRPGMVTTDLLLNGMPEDSKEAERVKRVFNILADKVETVTPYLVKKVIKNRKQGARIQWLTRRKVFFRFLTASFFRRKVID
ncbi:MAG: SDR family oxidoreductase [Spirochaetales bacterium]|nr:SDR family oxidoreductase [Spirochaetales bacterium]